MAPPPDDDAHVHTDTGRRSSTRPRRPEAREATCRPQELTAKTLRGLLIFAVFARNRVPCRQASSPSATRSTRNRLQARGHVIGGQRAAAGVESQAIGQQLREAFGAVGTQLPDVGGFARDDGVRGLEDAGTDERMCAGECFVEGDGQAPEIERRRRRRVTQRFRRQIRDRADDVVRSRQVAAIARCRGSARGRLDFDETLRKDRTDDAREAEVEQLRRVVLGEADVARLDVAVQQAATVQILQRAGQRQSELADLGAPRASRGAGDRRVCRAGSIRRRGSACCATSPCRRSSPGADAGLTPSPAPRGATGGRARSRCAAASSVRRPGSARRRCRNRPPPCRRCRPAA